MKRSTSSQTLSEADSLARWSCQNLHFQNLRMPILHQAEIHARHTLRKEARDVVRQIPVWEQVQNVLKMPFLGHAVSNQPVVLGRSSRSGSHARMLLEASLNTRKPRSPANIGWSSRIFFPARRRRSLVHSFVNKLTYFRLQK